MEDVGGAMRGDRGENFEKNAARRSLRSRLAVFFKIFSPTPLIIGQNRELSNIPR